MFLGVSPLGGWGMKIFSNFTDGIQVMIHASNFANFRHMIIDTAMLLIIHIFVSLIRASIRDIAASFDTLMHPVQYVRMIYTINCHRRKDESPTHVCE